MKMMKYFARLTVLTIGGLSLSATVMSIALYFSIPALRNLFISLFLQMHVMKTVDLIDPHRLIWYMVFHIAEQLCQCPTDE